MTKDLLFRYVDAIKKAEVARKLREEIEINSETALHEKSWNICSHVNCVLRMQISKLKVYNRDERFTPKSICQR